MNHPTRTNPFALFGAPFAGVLESRMPSVFSVDIDETDENYKLRADLPGVAKKDVEVNLADGVVTIGAEFSPDDGDGEGKHKRLFAERPSGKVRRRFALPRDAAREGVEASLTDGVLLVTVPKNDSAKNHRISVQ